MVSGMTQASEQQTLPAVTQLAYTICHEESVWLRLPYNQRPNKGRRAIGVCAQNGHDNRWEFYLVEHVHHGSPALEVSLFPEAWPAFRQIPQFFAALAAGSQALTLEGVVALLDGLGAVDETQRHSTGAQG